MWHRKALGLLIFCFPMLQILTAIAEPTDRPLNYQIHCEGCHGAAGAGLAGLVPAFVDELSSYLHISEGRKFIIQVPGVSQSSLNDAEVAELMNWMVVAYDPQGMPENFRWYTEEEVALLRSEPISETVKRRAAVHKMMNADRGSSVRGGFRYAADFGEEESAGPALESKDPPDSFTLCAACHTTSTDGANSMGPNLRGIIGRKSGSYPSFSFSKAMQTANFVWSEQTLDEFIENPRKAVPNNSMTFFGEADPARRKEIIEYLLSLQ
ncbi:MAG: c-type cytochrome [Halioglobus sp.]